MCAHGESAEQRLTTPRCPSLQVLRISGLLFARALAVPAGDIETKRKRK